MLWERDISNWILLHWMVELTKHHCGPSKFILKSHVYDDFYKPLVCDPNKLWHVSGRVTYSGRVQDVTWTGNCPALTTLPLCGSDSVLIFLSCAACDPACCMHVVCPLPSITEEFSCKFGSSKYYALCGFGGILSCGLTHTAVVPLDLVKCRLQVCMEAEPHGSNE